MILQDYEKSEIERRISDFGNIHKKYGIKSPSNPFVILCGDIEDVKKCYVVVNNHRYSFEHLTTAIEFCFKCYKVFQLEFVETCKHVWSFLQKRPYKIPLQSGHSFSCIDELVRKLDTALKKDKGKN